MINKRIGVVVLIALGLGSRVLLAADTTSSVQVTIGPGARFTISGPAGTKVITPPVQGAAYQPPAPLPMCATSQKTYPECQLSHDYEDVLKLESTSTNAFAILQYPEKTSSALDNRRQTAFLLNFYLRDYGFAGIEEDSRNHPAAWEPDPEKRQLILVATDSLRTHYISRTEAAFGLVSVDAKDLIRFRALLSSGNAGPLTKEVQSIVDEISSALNLKQNWTAADWNSVLSRSAIDLERGSDQANNLAAVRVSTGLNEIEPEIIPNELLTYPQLPGDRLPQPVNQDNANPSLVQLNLRGLYDLPAENGSAKALLDYWTQVSQLDIANDADIYFLTGIAHNGDTWQTTLTKLIADLTAAVTAIEKWRNLELALYSFLESGVVPDSPSGKSALPGLLTGAKPDLSAQQISIITLSVQRYAFFAATDGPPVSPQVIATLVDDELGAIPVYEGAYVEVNQRSVLSQRSGAASVSLIQRNYRSNVGLPYSVWKLGLSGTNLPWNDPFESLIEPYLTTMGTTYQLPYFTDAASENIFFTSLEALRNYSAELTDKIRQEAPLVRAYARALGKQVIEEIKYQRNGRITVPEPAIAEAVYASAGSSIHDNQPIATIRPTFRYILSARIDAITAIQPWYVPGSAVGIKLSCAGPIATSPLQKDAILKRPDSDAVYKDLVTLMQAYTAKTAFRGTVVSNIPVVEGDLSGMNVVALSLDIPEGSRTVSVSLISDSVIKAMPGLGFRLVADGNAAGAPPMLSLDYGPFEIGDKCSATLSPLGTDAQATMETSAKWRNVDSNHSQ